MRTPNSVNRISRLIPRIKLARTASDEFTHKYAFL